MKALIVDDSRAIRLMLKKMLAATGFDSLLEAGHGREALEVLRGDAGVVDLALVDWNMPEMNGLEFVAQVRADQAFANMRVVMVTTEAETTQMARALEAGADEYLMKPFTLVGLREKLGLLGLAGGG